MLMIRVKILTLRLSIMNMGWITTIRVDRITLIMSIKKISIPR